MKVKFILAINDISGDKLILEYDYMLLRFLENEIINEFFKLSELIEIGKTPLCLSNQIEFDKVIIICNSATSIFLFNSYKITENAELWIIKWPEKINSTNNPDKYKLFDTIPQIMIMAKELYN